MRRILELDIVLFAAGFTAGAALASPAAPIALIGFVAAAVYRTRFGRRWAVVAWGLFTATLIVAAQTPAPTRVENMLRDGPADFELRGTLRDGPRVYPDGQSYLLELDRIDRRAAGGLVRLYTRQPSRLAAPDHVKVFARCSLFSEAEFPGDRGAAERWRARGVVARCSSSESVEAAPGRTSSPLNASRRWLTRRRLAVERNLSRVLGRRAGVPIAMLTGTRGLVTYSEMRAHQRAGTAHLLAISGVHFGALAALVWWLVGLVLRRIPRVTRTLGAPRASAGVVLLVMFAYLLFVGAPVSAVRAFVAMAAVALALLLGRRPSGLAAVSAAAILLLALSPGLVWDLGFQLSFAATLAIVLFWHRLPGWLAHDRYAFEQPGWLGRTLRSLGRFACMSWIATAVTAPLLLGATGELSVVAFLTNLFAVPLVGLGIFPALLGGTLMLDVAPSLGEPAVWWTTEGMLRLTILLEDCAAVPGAVLDLGTPPRWWSMCACALVLVVVAARLRPKALASAALVIAVGFGVWRGSLRHDVWRFHFIPVGQGDATLIESPSGSRVLVDAGGSRFGRDPGRWIVVPYLHRIGAAHLDAVIVTHADTDHAGGVPAVLEQIDVDRLVTDPVAVDGLELERWLDHGSRNERSIIAVAQTPRSRVMLTGDAERASERAWLAGSPTRVTVLKVPHHGSRTSSTAAFLDVAAPAIAVVSAGLHNRFGHPHPTVVRRYRERAVRLYSTATAGLVRVEVDPHGVITTRVRRP